MKTTVIATGILCGACVRNKYQMFGTSYMYKIWGFPRSKNGLPGYDAM
jgi:hypothetical protein